MCIYKEEKRKNDRFVISYLIGIGVFISCGNISLAQNITTTQTTKKTKKLSEAQQLSELGEQKTDFGQGYYICAESEKTCTMWNAIKVVNLDLYKGIKYRIGGLDLTFPKGRPTLISQDKHLKISLGMVFNYDVGGFIGPDNKYGENVAGSRGYIRRGRFTLGVQYDDFVLTVSPDYGEFFRGTYNLYEANLAYKGFKNTNIVIGLYQPRSSMEDAESSTGYEFMERPAIVDAVRNIAGGEPRLTFGAQHYGKRYMISAYITGQRLGEAFQQNFTNNQIGGVFRAAVHPIATRDIDLHLGMSSSFALHGDNKKYGISARQDAQLWLSKQYIRTGTLQGVDNVWSMGPEVGFRWKRAVLQSEFYNIHLSRNSSYEEYRPNYNFKGWYILSSYTIFGQPRTYNQARAIFEPPKGPLFNPAAGYWGALEWNARFSQMDLDDRVHSYSSSGKFQGVQGGKQTMITTGVNWSPSQHMRIMLEYHRVHATGSKGNRYNLYGRKSDFITSRLQFSF
ncbi:OprO/OprP family phosphate-selective porin [Commensalibacter papalotli (ex Botero et al. 2024)]|uniref:Phosphate-selective porin (OprP) (PDB:2O4V) n=1 Tax=Commensalibacter papalotli (ex Botero et al. 2024) TaxID=2972766 RepID=A0ABM9HP99_9PROT|nr:porin [Commensalibacter papalotli (ex Botero et al. 2024)]CAI3933672.1 Phosphate-selective porin (OprP) (PDB:2O4V) [Commensalibacter papalotli (ex Botero et al. 2024)]CAI3941978.1 Phosphate-selective porin (OprP) (PDB:2O4V) [Commensalibacter papalotli (ex Botero et al. 2024)]